MVGGLKQGKAAPMSDAENIDKPDLQAVRTAMQSGDFAGALTLALAALEQASGDEEALYMAVVCRRFLKQYDAALESLDALKAARPGYGRAYQEAGHVQAARGDTDAAIDEYRRAVLYNSSLLASWQALTHLLPGADQPAALAEAKDQVFKLSALPPELLSVRNMTAEGRYYEAERLCRHYMQKDKTNIEGMRLLANLGVKTGVLDDAEFILESAVAFAPDNNFARNDYVGVLYRRQKFSQALEQAKILLDKEPENLDYRVNYANQCIAVGDYDPALEIYEDAIAIAPGRPDLHLVHGHALKTIGHVDRAIEAYRKAYGARENFGDAYWSLANLKTYRFTDVEVAAMQTWENHSSSTPDDQANLSFALGKHFEDAKDFQAAFSHYDAGNARRKAQYNYDKDHITARLKLQKEHCGKELFDPVRGHDAPDPIFIVGLPRAGSTLLEQILSSHSQIDGTLELPNIPALASKIDGRRRAGDPPRYPVILKDIKPDILQKMGKAFIDDTRVHRAGAPFFIDKMPNNFRHIGLIKLILPNAKIIDARRHPMACCFSGFKQNFASGQEFTYGLPEIGQYYRDYVHLMDHWDAVLPGQILRVQYEDVVADLEIQVRRMLDYLNLPFEQGCVDYHQTERSVRTPSSEQVRQPIFKSGLEQWKNFEPWLDPLKEALGPVLERYPIT